MLEAGAKTIAVEKLDGDQGEVARSADLEVDGELKMRADVTIPDHSVADTAEVKI